MSPGVKSWDSAAARLFQGCWTEPSPLAGAEQSIWKVCDGAVACEYAAAPSSGDAEEADGKCELWSASSNAGKETSHATILHHPSIVDRAPKALRPWQDIWRKSAAVSGPLPLARKWSRDEETTQRIRSPAGWRIVPRAGCLWTPRISPKLRRSDLSSVAAASLDVVVVPVEHVVEVHANGEVVLSFGTHFVVLQERRVLIRLPRAAQLASCTAKAADIPRQGCWPRRTACSNPAPGPSRLSPRAHTFLGLAGAL